MNGAKYLIHSPLMTARFMRLSYIYILKFIIIICCCCFLRSHLHHPNMIGTMSSVLFSQLDIHLMLVSLDEQRIPSLQTPYLCCRPTLSVRHLCQVKQSATSICSFFIMFLEVFTPYYH